MILPWSFPVFHWHLEEQISRKHGKPRQFRSKRNPFQTCQPYPRRFFFWPDCPCFGSSAVTQRNCRHADIKKWMERAFIIISRRPLKSQNNTPWDFVGRAHIRCLTSVVIHWMTSAQRWSLSKTCPATDLGSSGCTNPLKSCPFVLTSAVVEQLWSQ